MRSRARSGPRRVCPTSRDPPSILPVSAHVPKGAKPRGSTPENLRLEWPPKTPKTPKRHRDGIGVLRCIRRPRWLSLGHEDESSRDGLVAETSVRFLRLLERERSLEHRCQLAARRQSEDVLEVGARRARRARDCDLVQDRVARVELDALGRDVPDDDDPPATPDAPHARVPGRRSRELEGHVAAAVRDPPDLVLELHALAQDDDLVGAGRAQGRDLALARRRRDRARSGETDQLERVDPDAAGGSRHEDCLAEGEAALAEQGTPRDGCRAVEERRLHEVEPDGHPDEGPDVGDDGLLVAAVHGHGVVPGAPVAARLLALAAGAALTARGVVRGDDPVPELEALDVRAEGEDLARDLVAEDARERGERVEPAPVDEVAVADAARRDLEEHGVGPRHGELALLDAEGAVLLVEDDRPHLPR